jgi:hypothetical protein
METCRVAPLVAASFLIGLWPAAARQRTEPQGCQSRFAVVKYDLDHPQDLSRFVWGELTKQQRGWWAKKGQRKFRGVCMVADPSEADYVIAWSTGTVDYHATRRMLESTEVPVLNRGTSDCRTTPDGKVDCTLQPGIESEYSIRALRIRETRQLGTARVLNTHTHQVQRWYESASPSADRKVFQRAVKFLADGK